MTAVDLTTAIGIVVVEWSETDPAITQATPAELVAAVRAEFDDADAVEVAGWCGDIDVDAVPAYQALLAASDAEVTALAP